MSLLYRIILFLFANFAALAIGGLFTGKGVPSDWYTSLQKAPWTPPGWVFGAAWTTIMVAFSIYMAYLWPSISNKRLILGIYLLQWVLNVAWNPAFFHFHFVGLALLVISALTVLIVFMIFYFRTELGWYTLLLAPYAIWLLIATSLNGYILLYN